MKANGTNKEGKTVEEFKCGWMARSMKAIGKMIKPTEKVD